MKVNIFLGVDRKDPVDTIQLEANLPRIDTSWYNVRELNGATHPGAALPFGMVSCAPSGLYTYRKGHPSGYNGKDFIGLSHFHHSGTGTIRWYYNYLLITPKIGDSYTDPAPVKITEEQGAPGWYSCSLNSDIRAEATVSSKSSMHRFIYPAGKDKKLVVDVCHHLQALDTIWVDEKKFPESMEIELVGNNTARGKVVMDGLPVYFYMELNTSVDSAFLYVEHTAVKERYFRHDGHITRSGFCFLFDGTSEKTIISKIGFSFKSHAQAAANLYHDYAGWNMQQAREAADTRWTRMLSRIEVRDEDPEAVSMFYSALYKALLKPAHLPGEHPFRENPDYWSDFATFWDIYSTQLPLIFTFYPEAGEKIIAYYLDVAREYGTFPPALLMKKGMPRVFSKQASALGSILFADAYFKKLRLEHWDLALELMCADLDSQRGRMFRNNIPLAPSRTHNIDYSYASFCTSLLARHLGKPDLADSLLRLSGNWRSMYGSDGILLDDRQLAETENYPMQHFNFYEGNKWNYSFKIWHDMQGLIELQGGNAAFLANLDWYFNIDKNPTLFQFQGLNNEVDYTVPYAYLYAGRPDRTQQIVRVAMAYRFRNTRGGWPGNDDSGAMSSWYVWNCVGLFPVAGQDIYLIGSPVFERVTFRVREKAFSIVTSNNSANQLYIQSATLNGAPYDKPYLSFEDLEKGGELFLVMGDLPSGWGTNHRPPSYNSGIP